MIIGCIYLDLQNIVKESKPLANLKNLFTHQDIDLIFYKYISLNYLQLENTSNLSLFSPEFQEAVISCLQEHQIQEKLSLPYTIVQYRSFRLISYYLNRLKHQIGNIILIELPSTTGDPHCGNIYYLLLRRIIVQLFKEKKKEYLLKVLCEELIPAYTNYIRILQEHHYEYFEGLVLLKGLQNRYQHTIVNLNMPMFQQCEEKPGSNQEQGQILFDLAKTYSRGFTEWNNGFVWLKTYNSLETLEQYLLVCYLPDIKEDFAEIFSKIEKIIEISGMSEALVEKLLIIFLGDNFKMAVSDAIFPRKYRETSSHIINGTRILDIFRSKYDDQEYFIKLMEEIIESRVILTYIGS